MPKRSPEIRSNGGSNSRSKLRVEVRQKKRMSGGVDRWKGSQSSRRRSRSLEVRLSNRIVKNRKIRRKKNAVEITIERAVTIGLTIAVFYLLYLYTESQKSQTVPQVQPYVTTLPAPAYENQYYDENYYPETNPQRQTNQALAILLLCSGAVAAGGAGLYGLVNLPKLLNSLGSGYNPHIGTGGFGNGKTPRIIFPKYPGFLGEMGGVGQEKFPKEKGGFGKGGYDPNMTHPDDIKNLKG